MLGDFARKVAGRLPFGLKYEVFYQSCRLLGVTGYEIHGENGSVFAPTFDQTIAKSYLRHRAWSIPLVSLINSCFERYTDGTFVDIGANIGLVTIPVSRRASVRCVAFEPDDQNFRLLQANVKMNCPHQNVELIKAAVFSENCVLHFHHDSWNSGDHRISGDGNQLVNAVRLDETPIPPGPLVIKVDTQGAEPGVLLGGITTLRAAEMIIMEFWPWGMQRMGQSPDQILTFLAEFPFGQVLRDGETPKSWAPMTECLEVLSAMATGPRVEYEAVDVIAVRQQFSVRN